MAKMEIRQKVWHRIKKSPPFMDASSPPQLRKSSFQGQAHSVLRDTSRIQWTEFAALRGLRCLPAIVAPLIYGIVVHQPVEALLAAVAAMWVGFGSFQKLYRSRLAPMLLASLSMAMSVLVGTQIGHGDAGLILAAALWGFLCGLSASVGPAATYIGTLSIVFLLVSASYPAPPEGSLWLAVIVLGAGLVQTGIISVCRFIWPKTDIQATPVQRLRTLKPWRGTRLALHTVRRSALQRRSAFRHGVRMALTMAVSTGLSRLSHDSHSYWMPMTTAIILQQDLRQTLTRALGRVGGTIVGVGLATLIAATLRPSPEALIALAVCFAWLSFGTLLVNYVLFASCLTACIVFLLSFAGLPELSVVTTRVMFTILGAAVALLAYAIRRQTAHGAQVAGV